MLMKILHTYHLNSSPKDPKPMAIEQDGQVDIQTIRDLISKKYLHPY